MLTVTTTTSGTTTIMTITMMTGYIVQPGGFRLP
jgi:hypothetical protein